MSKYSLYTKSSLAVLLTQIMCKGIGAVFYVEHTRHLFPKPGEALTQEEDNLTRAMIPVVYWLVLFSIIFHGLSIPALDLFYRWKGVPPIVEDNPTEVQVLSSTEAMPNNAYKDPSKRSSIMVMNRFSRGSTIHDFNQNSWNDIKNKGMGFCPSIEIMKKLTCVKDVDDISLAENVQAVPHSRTVKISRSPNEVELQDRDEFVGVQGRPREWV